jgi:hypothetical protein
VVRYWIRSLSLHLIGNFFNDIFKATHTHTVFIEGSTAMSS